MFRLSKKREEIFHNLIAEQASVTPGGLNLLRKNIESQSPEAAGQLSIAEMLKMREVYRHLSNAADRGDEAANTIADIVVKRT